MQWFKHDTDANQDAKLKHVVIDYGLEGYGLYWYCLELIAGKVDKDNITFQLEHDAKIIAHSVGSSEQRVSEIMRYFVKIGLFENCDGVISCLKMAKRLDKSMTSNAKMRDLIDRIKNHHDTVMTQSGSIMQEENRIDKNRREENRDKHLSASQAKANEPDDVSLIFEYWCKVMGKDSRTKLTGKRKSKINARLKDGFTGREICEAIAGCAKSPHHMGDNDTGAIYDDIELICRDDAKVKMFISINRKRQAPYSRNTAKTIDTLSSMDFE